MFKVITICGSLKFIDDMMAAKKKFERQYDIVHLPNLSFDGNEIAMMDEWTLQVFHEVHNTKMRNSDYIYVVNPGGYVGKDTQREIDYANEHNIPVQYMVEMDVEPKKADLSNISDDDLIHEVEHRVEIGQIELNVEMCKK